MEEKGTPMRLPDDYLERVYAGILGKMIGVYLGRPFENWSFERITAELGEIRYYVHEKLNRPLILTDDDLSGTFTFIRALPDHGNRRDITPSQIGQTWLNYLIEHRTVLWWGGRGNSTEHTVYLNLKDGVPAPLTGSADLNGPITAQQVGAQIFIDGWGMVAPGDPEFAADLAGRAASVSHAGEAVYAARLLAAMEALAFVEPNLERLLDAGLRVVPHKSLIYRLVCDIREWRDAEPDWRMTRSRIARQYGYDRYPGNCHIVPNHALIHLALLYGDGDFQKSLTIVNTSGWDTDCNSGNVGCLLGIRGGLAGIDTGPDWRGPLADRMYLSSADGGRSITNAASEAYHIANIGRALLGEPPLAPKAGARCHFELPGSVMGFCPEETPESRGLLVVENTEGHSLTGKRSLALRFSHLAPGRAARVSAATFIPPEAIQLPGPYTLQACPTLYPGQTVRARVCACPANTTPVSCALFIRSYTAEDTLITVQGPVAEIAPGAEHLFQWQVPDQGGAPIAQVGLELCAARRADGSLYLDYLSWDGAPNLTLTRPATGGALWRRAWVDGVDHFIPWTWTPDTLRLVQNHGRGLLIQGTREWTDYQVEASVTPLLVKRAGIAVRVQGMNRYYALLLDEHQTLRLVKVLEDERTLAEAHLAWEYYQPVQLRLQALGNRLQAWVGGQIVFDCLDEEPGLSEGGIAVVCEEGSLACGPVSIRPTGI